MNFMIPLFLISFFLLAILPYNTALFHLHIDFTGRRPYKFTSPPAPPRRYADGTIVPPPPMEKPVPVQRPVAKKKSPTRTEMLPQYLPARM
ncbi:hypothetical protein PCANC_18081 [Puccinia coronata f. sp. avenae]|uniref:Secreted protein n=1 Tax=Puccinia coronata f. sp. avenae TaxID=200324 RepID=A0A2N5SLL7_9BASI|nr:hypothetical protein PCANC_18081 [Puccinia coronata f. sp. avenae]